ncbi:MAG TPA: CpaD family pilus assembly protein [Croceibacterium sp.]|nr:CpaD family pilus assembly protein [Croceibacterium sp.]
MPIRTQSAVAAAIALSLGLALSACGDSPNNRSLYSTKQPVVERHNYTLDLAAGAGGLAIPEQQRLADWFETMDLAYGDRVAIDGTVASAAARDDIAAIASRHGILLSEGAPVTPGYVDPGMVRVVVTRSRAYVPGCPDWSDQVASNLRNATSDDYGCAVNSNIAAMVADPEHLLAGAAGSGETVVMSSTKAIETYRAAEPTGKAGLPEVSSQSGGGN